MSTSPGTTPDSRAVAIRPLALDDGPELWAIREAAIDAGELHGLESEPRERWLEHLPFDLGRTLVAELDGRLAGYLDPESHLLVVTLPVRRRGVGSALIAHADRTELLATGAVLTLWLPVNNPAAEAFLNANSYRYHSSFWQMRLTVIDAVPPPELADGVVVRSYHADDIAHYVDLFNRAFQDHASPLSVTRELVAAAHARAAFDPGLIGILESTDHPGRLVGFIRVSLDTTDGSIDFIGVAPDSRGRGYGVGLLRWGVQTLRHRGATTIELGVESRNDRALGLYRAAGFTPTFEYRRWARSAR